MSGLHRSDFPGRIRSAVRTLNSSSPQGHSGGLSADFQRVRLVCADVTDLIAHNSLQYGCEVVVFQLPTKSQTELIIDV